MQGKDKGEGEVQSGGDEEEAKKKRMLTTLCVPVRSPITVLTQPDRV